MAAGHAGLGCRSQCHRVLRGGCAGVGLALRLPGTGCDTDGLALRVTLCPGTSQCCCRSCSHLWDWLVAPMEGQGRCGATSSPSA